MPLPAEPQLGGEEPQMPMGDQEPSNGEMPFDKEPFDAGVEADENSDPKKYLQQLTGKIGQSLRNYSESQGQPDLELEKFIINSILSATHTSQMDDEDKNDIIKKVEKSGNDVESNGNEEDGNNEPIDEPSSEEPNLDQPDEGVNENLFLKEPKRNNMFQPGSNDVLKHLKESCWSGYKQVGMKEKDGKQVPNCVPVNESNALLGKRKNSIFAKKDIMNILRETFLDDTEVKPMEPTTKPVEQPVIKPTRRERTFKPGLLPEIAPKAENNG